MSKLLDRFAAKLFKDKKDQLEFISKFSDFSNNIIGLAWLKKFDQEYDFLKSKNIVPDFFEFMSYVDKSLRPGNHELFDQGYYYCLDYSSVFAASVFKEIKLKPRLIVDTCASPGGKSVLAWKYFSPEKIICNEVVSKRIKPLISNLKRCEIKPSYIASLEVGHLSQKVGSQADLVLVDAPCSGQSLLMKGYKVDGCFHPLVIKKNQNRQKKIIYNASSLLREGGYLAYMTCTFSKQENEDVISWFLKKNSDFELVKVNHLQNYQSHLTTLPMYRLWPHQSPGVGSFTALLKKKGDLSYQSPITFDNLSWVWKCES